MIDQMNESFLIVCPTVIILNDLTVLHAAEGNSTCTSSYG